MNQSPAVGSSETGLPLPEPEALTHSQQLVDAVCGEAGRCGDSLPFDRYMEQALYAPGLGYYVAGARKFGAAGDFVTAPEISPLFGRLIARQCVQVLDEVGGGDILEFGAGSGALAADLLGELERLGKLPGRYWILELSPDLRARQRHTLSERVPELLSRVGWLDRLPEPGFRGVVLANEVLDAMPVQRFRLANGDILEERVRCSDEGLVAEWAPASDELVSAVSALKLEGFDDYESEINLRGELWIAALGAMLATGAVLLIDYGYTRAEYYHPQRSRGTLMCYYRHHSHPDPLLWPGLQDITAHVDFSAMAEAAIGAGLAVAGYTSQAYFLMGCGLDRLVGESDPEDVANHMALVQGVKTLTMPNEMGERFRVLALTREMSQPLMGFAIRDMRERL